MPPVVFTKLSNPSASSRERRACAPSTTRSQPTDGSGSRSNTTRSGRSSSLATAFQVWISRMPICTSEMRPARSSTTRYSPILVFSWMATRRRAGGAHTPECFM